jgi:hypothetical protein
MKTPASPLAVICCGSMRLRPARPTTERDGQSYASRARSADMSDNLGHQSGVATRARTGDQVCWAAGLMAWIMAIACLARPRGCW